jgi:uncharacterized protein (DUF697 family)
MSLYENSICMELKIWKKEILKPLGMFENATKEIQGKVNDLIPQKVQKIITSTIKGIVQSTLFGMEFVPKRKRQLGLTIEQRDKNARELLKKYKRIAVAEGAGTGAGGIFLGIVDFPVLISIKMKFLFELAHVYGFNTRDQKERLFLLYVFQLAFSSRLIKSKLLSVIENWETSYDTPVDWEQFQREYRDSIDFRKMLQLIPGIGAIVGAWANYGLLEDLGHVGMNCFRMRLLKDQLTF